MDNSIDDNISQISSLISNHQKIIQDSIESITTAANQTQEAISEILKEQIYHFEIRNAKFVTTQDFRSRILVIENKMNGILSGPVFNNGVKDYLNSFTSILNSNISLHKSINGLKVEVNLLSPARKLVYEQAKDALNNAGIRTVYLDPVKHMLMQQVTTGGSVSDMGKILSRWNTGDLSGSNSPTGKPIYNLSQYATQLARDTSYQFNGTINEIIKDKYSLDAIVYTGDAVEDSRPLCKYLISKKLPISLIELQELLQKKELLPGRIKGTNSNNFCTYRGGYSCRHIAFPVRHSE